MGYRGLHRPIAIRLKLRVPSYDVISNQDKMALFPLSLAREHRRKHQFPVCRRSAENFIFLLSTIPLGGRDLQMDCGVREHRFSDTRSGLLV